MRPRRTSPLDSRPVSAAIKSGEAVALLALCAVAAWLIWSFGQEMLLSHRLSAQAVALQQQNTSLESENAGYQKDIAAVASGASAEEDARINGYARSGEKVYVIGAPPADPHPAPAIKVVGAQPAPWDSLRAWLAGHVHL